MDNFIQQPLPQDESPLTAPDPHSPLRVIFLNDRGLRAGWRLAIYILIVLIFGILVNLALDKMFHLSKIATSRTSRIFLLEVLQFVLVFLPACVMARVERRSVDDYGLPLDSAFGWRFWQGCALGVVEICALMACIASFGGYSFGALNIHGAAILEWLLFWALFFVVVGLFEEFTFRGYLQFTLADGIGFWPAAWILSLGFGAVHLGNKGEGWVGAAGVVMIGLVFALALKRTGNLWLVIGWHAAFDFGETFLFSVPNSGNVFEGNLSNAALHGPNWLTGGTVGPEGSVFSFVTMAVAALFIHKAFPARKCAEPDPAALSSPTVTSQ